jgi:hypothetical protein
VAITLPLPIRSRRQALRHVPNFLAAAISPELMPRAEITFLQGRLSLPMSETFQKPTCGLRGDERAES